MSVARACTIQSNGWIVGVQCPVFRQTRMSRTNGSPAADQQRSLLYQRDQACKRQIPIIGMNCVTSLHSLTYVMIFSRVRSVSCAWAPGLARGEPLGPIRGFTLRLGDKVRGEPIEWVSTDGVLCNGSTADSGSASLGSNPSTPAFPTRRLPAINSFARRPASTTFP